MATSNSKVATQAAIMGVRESLMEYFKGTCIQRMTAGGVVVMRSANDNVRRNMMYLRREYENQQPMVLSLGGLPIATVQKSPERLVIYDKLLNRSPQLKAVKKGLEDFTSKYLAGVEVEHDQKGVFHA